MPPAFLFFPNIILASQGLLWFYTHFMMDYFLGKWHLNFERNCNEFWGIGFFGQYWYFNNIILICEYRIFFHFLCYLQFLSSASYSFQFTVFYHLVKLIPSFVYVLLMLFFVRQKLLSLIRSLCLFLFSLGGGSKNILWFMTKSVFPMFSSVL